LKILQTVKFYSPSKGGMESVVQNIVEGVIQSSLDKNFTIYANSHLPSFKRELSENGNIFYVKESTPFLYKSQPLNFRYGSLKKLISEADVIHHHYPFPNMELALFMNRAMLKNKKLIITWHANIKNSRWSWISKYYNPLVKNLLSMASKIVVTSPQLFEHSDLLKAYKDKVIVIPLSFDPNISEYRKSKRFPEGRRFRLLFVGKLREYKGINYLIEAIKDLEVDLTIVGDGEKEVTLRDQVDGLGLNNVVTFLKGISNEALKKVYENTDLFILPSINEAEAFGVVQLEAMSNGLPVINTHLESGVPYVSLNGITGFTIEPKSSAAIRNAIIRIISNKNLYEELSKNAIERSKEFTREKMAQSYLKLYNS
jgi:glycosyltransferase involved in cell wall biosynthesis